MIIEAPSSSDVGAADDFLRQSYYSIKNDEEDQDGFFDVFKKDQRMKKLVNKFTPEKIKVEIYN